MIKTSGECKVAPHNEVPRVLCGASHIWMDMISSRTVDRFLKSKLYYSWISISWSLPLIKFYKIIWNMAQSISQSKNASIWDFRGEYKDFFFEASNRILLSFLSWLGLVPWQDYLMPDSFLLDLCGQPFSHYNFHGNKSTNKYSHLVVLLP